MQIGGIETGGGKYIGTHRGTECQVPACADAHCAQPAGAIRVRLQIIERGPRVGVIGRYFFRSLERIAALATGLIVCDHGSGWHQFVINFRNDYDVAISCQISAGTGYRACNLKDFREQQQPWKSSRADWLEDAARHGSGGCCEFDDGFGNGHEVLPRSSASSFSVAAAIC